MNAAKILVSLPQELNLRFKAVIPARQRSAMIQSLLEKELNKREKALYDCACAVEADDNLNAEMDDWNTTLNDGLNTHESW